MSDQQLASLAAYSGDPWSPSNPYFVKAEKDAAWLWANLIEPFIGDTDYSVTLDLAAGHGRNSVFLQPLAHHLTITDIQAGNIEVCRGRFGSLTNVSFEVGNGYDFQPTKDAALSLIYCFDAMVHFDSDVVRSYLRDAVRVLKPGGRGFFHHSNMATGADWRKNPVGRNFMTRELFAHYAVKEGLSVVRQKTINWGGIENCDCLSLVEKVT